MAKIGNAIVLLGEILPTSNAGSTLLIPTGVAVDIDLDEDGRRIHRAVFQFADDAALQAEYYGNTGTTALDAAVVAYLGGLGATDDENLKTQWAGYVGDHTTAWVP